MILDFVFDVVFPAGILVFSGWMFIKEFKPKPVAPPVLPADYEKVRAAVEALGAPALRLVPTAEPEFSQIGGIPELPTSVAWPRDTAGGALGFLAQLDLAAA